MGFVTKNRTAPAYRETTRLEQQRAGVMEGVVAVWRRFATAGLAVALVAAADFQRDRPKLA